MINVYEDTILRVSHWGAFSSAVLLAGLFVGGLYVWKNDKNLDRDHPEIIKRRIISTGFVSIISGCIVYAYADYPIADGEKGVPFWRWLGITSDKLFEATVYPIFLTMVWFNGSIVLNIIANFSGPKWGRSFATSLKVLDENRLVTIRNIIVGPFCEEWVFRACVCSLMIAGGWSPFQTVFISPLLFGAAHLHHFVNYMKVQGYSVKESLGFVCVQLLYTSIFGIYATILFVKTGHFTSAWLCHALCNFLSLPDHTIIDSRHPQYKYRYVIIILHLLGLTLCTAGLVGTWPILDPHNYNSWFYEYHNRTVHSAVLN